jgi:bacterioferritin-associated ferredoxin
MSTPRLSGVSGMAITKFCRTAGILHACYKPYLDTSTPLLIIRRCYECIDADSPAMMVCSCNIITDKEIRETIISLLDEDCWQLIVPGKVYHAMAKRGRCCGCFPNVVDIIVKTTEEYHACRQSEGAEVVDFMERLKRFHHEQKMAIIERRHGIRAA